MKDNLLFGNVSVFGSGKFGRALIYNLAVKKIGMHCHSYTISGQEFDDEYGTQFVDTVSVNRLQDNVEVSRIQKQVTCMIVTVTGNELINNLDLLINLGVPLLFCFNDLNENIELLNILNSKDNVPTFLSQDINLDDLTAEIILSLEFLEQVSKNTAVA